MRTIKKLWRLRNWRPVLICGQCKEIMLEKSSATFDWFECPSCGARAIKSAPGNWPITNPTER